MRKSTLLYLTMGLILVPGCGPGPAAPELAARDDVPLPCAAAARASAGPAIAFSCPTAQEPEKISISAVDWNVPTQQIVISLQAQFGIATAGSNDAFLMVASVEVREHVLLAAQVNVSTDTPQSDPPRDGLVDLEPILIGWDRNGGTFAGVARVIVSVELRNPAGIPIGTAHHEADVVFTGDGTVP